MNLAGALEDGEPASLQALVFTLAASKQLLPTSGLRRFSRGRVVLMHIAIVTYNWPPRNAIGTHRPYAWAKYWSRLGVEVTVLTARKQPFDEPLDLNLGQLPGVKVIEVGSGGSASLLASTMGTRFGKLMRRVKRALRSSFGIVLDPRDTWVRAAAEQAATIAGRVDVVISTFGPRASHIIAAGMKRKRPTLLWVADYRDLWSNNHLASYSSRALRREMALEIGTVGASADAIVTVSQELADQQKRYFQKPVWVIPNGFDDDISSGDAREKGNKPKRIVYTGMIYPGTRDPTPLLAALKELVDDRMISPGAVEVEFYGPPEPWLDNVISSFDLDSFVSIRGRVSREEALGHQASADLLLLLESASPEASGVLTGKIFEYLATGRPILSLGTRRGFAISRVLEECGAGLCAENNVPMIKRVLLDILKGKPLLWFAPNQSAIAKYSRREQAVELLNLIRSQKAQQAEGLQ